MAGPRGRARGHCGGGRGRDSYRPHNRQHVDPLPARNQRGRDDDRNRHRLNFYDDVERERHLEQELEERRRTNRILWLEKEIRAEDQIERKLRAETESEEERRKKPEDTAAGANRPVSTGAGMKIPPSMPKGNGVVRQHGHPHVKQAIAQKMREDRDAPAQRGKSVTVLDYDGFNNEAVRYGGGSKRDDRAQSEQGGEVPKKLKIDEAKLKQKIEKYRALAAMQTAGAPDTGPVPGAPAETHLAVQASPEATPRLRLAPLPTGVIPGITPGWERYLQLVPDESGA